MMSKKNKYLDLSSRSSVVPGYCIPAMLGFFCYISSSYIFLNANNVKKEVVEKLENYTLYHFRPPPCLTTTSGTPRANASQTITHATLIPATRNQTVLQACRAGKMSCSGGPEEFVRCSPKMEPSTKGSTTPEIWPIELVMEYMRLAMFGSGAMSIWFA